MSAGASPNRSVNSAMTVGKVRDGEPAIGAVSSSARNHALDAPLSARCPSTVSTLVATIVRVLVIKGSIEPAQIAGIRYRFGCIRQGAPRVRWHRSMRLVLGI